MWSQVLISVVLLLYCGVYVYRCVIVDEIVEQLRSSYYEKHVNIFFITFWDEVGKEYESYLFVV